MVLQTMSQMLIMWVRAAMVPVPSSYQQSMAYADLHGGSLNPNDWFVIFIGKPRSCPISLMKIPHPPITALDSPYRLAGANDLIYTVNGVQNATVPGVVQYINMTMTASYAAGARQ